VTGRGCDSQRNALSHGDQSAQCRDGGDQCGTVGLVELREFAAEDLLAQRRADRAERLTRALAGLPPEDTARITDAVPALTRLADALRRSATPPEVNR